MILRTGLAVFVSTWLYGCSTSSNAAPSNADAGEDAADASHPFRQAGCPESLPTEGEPCVTPAPTCEYGDDPHCRTTAGCGGGSADGSHWSLNSNPSCKPNAASCPQTFAGVSNGAVCAVNAICTYPEGQCGCAPCNTGTRDVPSAGSEWECSAWLVPESCPVVAPLLGTACDVEGQECAYAVACCSSVDLGYDMRCEAGYWHNAGGGCACGLGLCQ